MTPEDEAKFDTVTYTYYEQLNGYEYLKQLDIGYFFYNGSYTEDMLKVLDPAEKTIVHIPNVNSRESTKDKIREVEHIIEELGEWQGADAETGFQLVRTPEGRLLRIADLVDDEQTRRDRVAAALKDPTQKSNRDHVDIIIALGMAKEGFDWLWCEHALTVGYRASLTEVVQIIGRATRDAPGENPRPLHQSDRGAGCVRRGGHRGGQRHAEGDCCQSPDGAGSCTAVQLRPQDARERAGGRRRLRSGRVRP